MGAHLGAPPCRYRALRARPYTRSRCGSFKILEKVGAGYFLPLLDEKFRFFYLKLVSYGDAKHRVSTEFFLLFLCKMRF
jgi:hypothetical protein